jgi:hypothetical protein
MSGHFRVERLNGVVHMEPFARRHQAFNLIPGVARALGLGPQDIADNFQKSFCRQAPARRRRPSSCVTVQKLLGGLRRALFAPLTSDERLGSLALRIEGVELLLKPLFA